MTKTDDEEKRTTKKKEPFKKKNRLPRDEGKNTEQFRSNYNFDTHLPRMCTLVIERETTLILHAHIRYRYIK